MGNDCLASSPIDHYKSYFQNVKTSEIKDFWTTIQVYKIKKLYDAACSKHPEFQKHTHLQLKQFLNLFPELDKYPQRQKLRVFQIFNFDGNGLVDWNNFYSMISICYFAPEDTLAVIMLLIFDQGLSQQLTRPQVQLMCEHNQAYIVTKQEAGQQIPIYLPEEIAEHLLKNRNSIPVEAWLKEYKNYFSMNKFRRIFNIFIEQKLQKDLIKNFIQYNNLYVPDEERYVSYLIDFKWFQSWKLYVKQQYGFCLNTANKKPVTFKTKKMMKTSGHVNGQKKVADPLTLRQLKFDDGKMLKSKKSQKQDDEVPEQVKNFDFIHSNIGEKPKEIYNKVLEGDYEQVLRQDIIQNRDYVLISEKVWKTLKRIYQGYPEFRRTGFDFIELYPKILRILPVKRAVIMYNEENIKQVSAYYAVEDILQAIITKSQVMNKKFYYKAIGMRKWQQISDLSTALAELTSQVIIYIAAVNQNQTDVFQKKYGKAPKDITEINVGDQITFQHPIRRREQQMVFLGKNIQGKYILHIQGESYIYDICVLEYDLLKKGKFNPGAQSSNLQEVKLKKKEDIGLIGIPNTKGLGYINSVILHLYYNWGFKQQLSLTNFAQDKNPQSLILTLSKIFKDLTNKKKINTKQISESIQQNLSDFNQFSADMCNQFFNQFYSQISKQLKQQKLKDYLEYNKIGTEKITFCKNCNQISNQNQERYCLSLPLHNNLQKYYEIVYVPFCQSLNGGQMKRYGFKIKSGATLKQYKDAFQTVAGLKGEDKKYLLMEVYANNIVKNYSTAKEDATLDSLLLRDTDTIVAYQLKLNFSDFITKHYSQNIDFDNNQIKIDQFIDCKNNTRGWIFGKVCEKDFTPYGHRTIIRVIHKFSKGQQWEISYDVDEESVANFPTKSYLNGEQYHVRLQQRYFNQASNDMEICNMPLIVVLTNWMRWRQFYYMIYLQMRKFINQESIQYEFYDENQQQNQFQIYSSKSLGSKNKKRTQKLKLNKFKQFLYGSEFPYKVNFIDYSGRCAICFKFLKSQVFQGQNETYCNGCELSTSQPISWQIKVADVMVCIDWKKLDYFKKEVIKDHSSYANLISQKKNDLQTLNDCLNALDKGYSQNIQQICCNVESEVIIKQKILSLPQNLTIFLERIIEQNGFIKIINKHVKFQDVFKIHNENYSLVGLTSIQGGSNKSTKYRTFIMMSTDEWLQYDGNIVRVVKKNYVEKLCVLNLYYKKKQTQQQKVQPKQESKLYQKE